MEIYEANGYQELFRSDVGPNMENIFPLAQKCIAYSSKEEEILRALQILFRFGLKMCTINEVDREIFHSAGPAAKRLFFKNLETLEKLGDDSNLQETSSTCFQLLNRCSEILSYLSEFFVQLNNVERITLAQVERFLLTCAELLHRCFCHCHASEKIYGSLFDKVSECLTSCFKKSCELLDLLICSLSDKFIFNLAEDVKEVIILCDILKWLSKCGTVLMNLDVKAMAKVWKSNVSLTEKYLNHIRDYFDTGHIISSLCGTVISTAENALKTKNEKEFTRKTKLSCFYLKLVIKFCEVFNGNLDNCHESLFNLLLTLCRCGISSGECENSQKITNAELLKQLSFGSDPLLGILLTDDKLAKQFSTFTSQAKNFDDQSHSFLILCCLILKKLMHQNALTRSIWFSNTDNIISWIFISVSWGKYDMCESKILPDVLIGGKQRKVNDLYQHVLIVVSAFAMTSTAKEFPLVEETLIKNVLQLNPMCALLAIDIWCLLARFCDGDLCLSQIIKLANMSQEFEYGTQRVEKCYLITLIHRLYPLLTRSQKETFKKSLRLPYSTRFGKKYESVINDGGFNLYLMNSMNSFLMCQIEKFISNENDSMPECMFDMDESLFDSGTEEKKNLESQVLRLWEFNPALLLDCRYKDDFIRIICLITAHTLPIISSENVLTILSQMKYLMKEQSTIVYLYFMWILDALSSITFPQDALQRRIIQTIADIFGALLQSEKVFAREKSLAVFFDFSHVTKHAEIVSSSVNHSQTLKTEVTNFFKKTVTPPTQSDLDSFMRKLCESEYRHVCQGPRLNDGLENVEKNSCIDMKRYSKMNSTENIDKIMEEWKRNGETLIQCSEQLTHSQKRDIRSVCNRLLSATSLLAQH